MKKYLLALLSLLVLGASYTTAQADEDALNTYLDLTPATTLTNGEYYYIVNPYVGYPNNQNGKYCAFVYQNNYASQARWGLIDNTVINTDINYVYQLEQVDDGWHIKSVASNKYVDALVSETGTLSASATVALTLTDNSSSTTTGNFRITINQSFPFYPGSSGYGSNTSGEIAANYWSLNDSPKDAWTYWRFYPVTEKMKTIIATQDAAKVERQSAIDNLKAELQSYANTQNYVFGITAENYSAAETTINALSAENNTLDEINAVKIEDYVTKLTSGYYRLQNPYWGNMDYTHSIMRLDSIKRAFFNVDATTESTYKSDLSTVCYITVPEDQENSLTPTGLTITSQGCRLTNVGSGSALYASESSSATARLLKSSGTNAHIGERNIQISNANNEYTYNSYVYKSGDGDNPARVLRPLSYDAPSGRFSFIKATDIIVNMNSIDGDNSTYATLYAPFAVTLPDGLTAYTGTLNTGNNSLTLSPVKSSVVPAATPVVLIGSEASYTLDIAAGDTSDPISSAFTGQYLADTTDDTGVYTLGAKNGVVGFYPYKNAIKANKARLNLSNSSDSKGFTFSFGDDDPTGINSATTSGAVLKVGDIIYDLQGRRVQDAKHGIYIINGKKTVVK